MYPTNTSDDPVSPRIAGPNSSSSWLARYWFAFSSEHQVLPSASIIQAVEASCVLRNSMAWVRASSTLSLFSRKLASICTHSSSESSFSSRCWAFVTESSITLVVVLLRTRLWMVCR